MAVCELRDALLGSISAVRFGLISVEQADVIVRLGKLIVAAAEAGIHVSSEPPSDCESADQASVRRPGGEVNQGGLPLHMRVADTLRDPSRPPPGPLDETVEEYAARAEAVHACAETPADILDRKLDEAFVIPDNPELQEALASLKGQPVLGSLVLPGGVEPPPLRLATEDAAAMFAHVQESRLIRVRPEDLVAQHKTAEALAELADMVHPDDLAAAEALLAPPMGEGEGGGELTPEAPELTPEPVDAAPVEPAAPKRRGRKPKVKEAKAAPAPKAKKPAGGKVACTVLPTTRPKPVPPVAAIDPATMGRFPTRVWCDQCDCMKARLEVKKCTSQFCDAQAKLTGSS